MVPLAPDTALVTPTTVYKGSRIEASLSHLGVAIEFLEYVIDLVLESTT